MNRRPSSESGYHLPDGVAPSKFIALYETRGVAIGNPKRIVGCDLFRILHFHTEFEVIFLIERKKDRLPEESVSIRSFSAFVLSDNRFLAVRHVVRGIFGCRSLLSQRPEYHPPLSSGDGRPRPSGRCRE